jgi:hypothetical protein
MPDNPNFAMDNNTEKLRVSLFFVNPEIHFVNEIFYLHFL